MEFHPDTIFFGFNKCNELVNVYYLYLVIADVLAVEEVDAQVQVAQVLVSKEVATQCEFDIPSSPMRISSGLYY